MTVQAHGSSDSSVQMFFVIFVKDGSIYLPLLIGRGLGTATFEVGNVFAPDDLWFGSDTNTHCEFLNNLYLDVLTTGCGFYTVALLKGEGMAYGGLPFLGTVCPIPDVGYIYLSWNNGASDKVSALIHLPPLGASVHGISLKKKKRLDKLPWTSCISDYIILY